MRVIVTGSSGWPEFDPVWRDLATVFHHCCGNGVTPVRPLVVVHGGNNTGTDYWANEWATLTMRLCTNVSVESRPVNWERYRNEAAPERNKVMVAAGADLVLAYPSASVTEDINTSSCLQLAHEAGIRIHNYTTDGPLKYVGRPGCPLCEPRKVLTHD